jgi:hypothetical protein
LSQVIIAAEIGLKTLKELRELRKLKKLKRLFGWVGGPSTVG